MGLRPTQGKEALAVHRPLSIESLPFPLSSRAAEGSAVPRTFPGNVFDRAQSASAAMEDANLDTCSRDSGSIPRASTASNAWPTSSRVGAKEVGR
jgi:hypothetical protein